MVEAVATLVPAPEPELPPLLLLLLPVQVGSRVTTCSMPQAVVGSESCLRVSSSGGSGEEQRQQGNGGEGKSRTGQRQWGTGKGAEVTGRQQL